MSNNNKKVSKTNPTKKSSSSGAGKVSKDPRFSSTSNYDFRYRPTIGNNSSQRQKFDARSLATAMMGGAVSGAVAGAAFYGAGKLFGAASQAIKSARNGSKGAVNSFGSGYNGAEYDDFIRRGVTGRATVNQFNPRLNMNLGFFGYKGSGKLVNSADVKFYPRSIDHAFGKRSSDFGKYPNGSNASVNQFTNDLKSFIDSGIQKAGTYRSIHGTHIYNSSTNQWVFINSDGTFNAAFKLSARQFKYLIETGVVK